MKTIFKVLDVKNEDGRWYETYQVSDDFPFEYPYIMEKPPESLYNPRYVFGIGWVEDDEALVESLKQENEELRQRLDMSDEALLELADMVLAATEAMKGGM